MQGCMSASRLAYGQGPKDPKDYKVGEPNFSLQGQGGGKNLRNFGAGYNAGVGTKVWESKNRDRSLELGVNYGQSVFRHQGHTFKSKPQYGVGGTFRWGKK
ncbi:uncharacterized protein LOC118198686 isoform X2 [Stegodyphus dumicola]|uniref:uncharacterized protein LOC118198686 isoform X2 n=1 Tax=Stegodyphus dumicola TaxID=202533 RepID=UPI0015ACE793|nr:uncharacterized protein LOC118198686 isoform X2 [Stegodyphus dumicola]